MYIHVYRYNNLSVFIALPLHPSYADSHDKNRTHNAILNPSEALVYRLV